VILYKQTNPDWGCQKMASRRLDAGGAARRDKTGGAVAATIAASRQPRKWRPGGIRFMGWRPTKPLQLTGDPIRSFGVRRFGGPPAAELE
jgi:hypothetical protein